jgi:hypothetical protein
MKKGIVIKKKIHVRRDAEPVNIDGRDLLWGKFR